MSKKQHKTEKPSSKHNNNRHHNWLIYKISDQFLNKNRDLYQGTLYDLGCGNVPYKDFFLMYAEKYVGVDWSESIHDSKADIIADLNKQLPIDSEVADTIVSWSVLEHLCEPQMMLNEACRILKPGGNIILQVPWQWRLHEAPFDFFRFTPYGLQYMFKKAGFIEVEVTPFSGFFSAWLLKFNYFSNTFIDRQPRLMRGLLKIVFIPIWYLNQWMAPFLDKLDKNWDAETSAYIIIGKK